MRQVNELARRVWLSWAPCDAKLCIQGCVNWLFYLLNTLKELTTMYCAKLSLKLNPRKKFCKALYRLGHGKRSRSLPKQASLVLLPALRRLRKEGFIGWLAFFVPQNETVSGVAFADKLLTRSINFWLYVTKLQLISPNELESDIKWSVIDELECVNSGQYFYHLF